MNPHQLKWDHWIDLYCEHWCVARNLRSTTILAYRDALKQFVNWAYVHHFDLSPESLTARIVLDYVVHLREDRKNGGSAVSRAIVVIKNFYGAMVAYGHLSPNENPMLGFPKLKEGRVKLPVFLSPGEMSRLLAQPKTLTVLGLRDRAILTLLYATGIRASECAGLLEGNVDLDERTIRVLGKGNRERTIQLNMRALKALDVYRKARGPQSPDKAFFRTKRGGPLSRKTVYDRVKKYGREARIMKRVSPHVLRHTCATHLVQRGANLVVLRDLLGHRQITSTQIYIHATAHDMKELAANHPVGKLAPVIEDLIEGVRLPIDHPPRRRPDEKRQSNRGPRASPRLRGEPV